MTDGNSSFESENLGTATKGMKVSSEIVSYLGIIIHKTQQCTQVLEMLKFFELPFLLYYIIYDRLAPVHEEIIYLNV